MREGEFSKIENCATPLKGEIYFLFAILYDENTKSMKVKRRELLSLEESMRVITSYKTLKEAKKHVAAIQRKFDRGITA